MRKYECITVFDGTIPADAANAEKETVEKLLKENGEFLETDEWGKRDLAYEIDGKKTGYYFRFLFNAGSDISKLLDKTFKLNDKVIRHMNVLYQDIPTVNVKELEEKKRGKNEEVEE